MIYSEFWLNQGDPDSQSLYILVHIEAPRHEAYGLLASYEEGHLCSKMRIRPQGSLFRPGQ